MSLPVTIPDSPRTAAVLPLLTLRLQDTPVLLDLTVRFFALRNSTSKYPGWIYPGVKKIPGKLLCIWSAQFSFPTSDFSHLAFLGEFCRQRHYRLSFRSTLVSKRGVQKFGTLGAARHHEGDPTWLLCFLLELFYRRLGVQLQDFVTVYYVSLFVCIIFYTTKKAAQISVNNRREGHRKSFGRCGQGLDGI